MKSVDIRERLSWGMVGARLKASQALRNTSRTVSFFKEAKIVIRAGGEKATVILELLGLVREET